MVWLILRGISAPMMKYEWINRHNSMHISNNLRTENAKETAQSSECYVLVILGGLFERREQRNNSVSQQFVSGKKKKKKGIGRRGGTFVHWTLGFGKESDSLWYGNRHFVGQNVSLIFGLQGEMKSTYCSGDLEKVTWKVWNCKSRNIKNFNNETVQDWNSCSRQNV